MFIYYRYKQYIENVNHKRTQLKKLSNLGTYITDGFLKLHINIHYFSFISNIQCVHFVGNCSISPPILMIEETAKYKSCTGIKYTKFKIFLKINGNPHIKGERNTY